MKELLFYYPQHFNRSQAGTNPFFDAMLEACDKAGISYDLLEEPDRGTDKPRNPKARKADCFFWSVIAVRKVLSILFPKKDFFWREERAARLYNLLTFGRYRYRRYITISGSMYFFFAYLNPEAEVYDMQHGILCKHHQTFFDQTTFRLRRQYYRSNLHFLVWGEGYKRCFEKGEEALLAERTHVVGYPCRSAVSSGAPRDGYSQKSILVSLQFTNDYDAAGLKVMKQSLWRFLEEVEPLGHKVVLKNHPRYNNCIALDDLLARFPFVEMTSGSLGELVGKTSLHVTYYSTTAFEFAEYGVPSFFIVDENDRAKSRLFYDDFCYPLYDGMTITEVLARLNDKSSYELDSATVRAWYDKFYTPFDEAAFLKLIR